MFPRTEESTETLFLSDQALTELDQDRLGHCVYVEALRQIIEGCETPFTIGLLGKWGTGKTSIGRILIGELSRDEELGGRFKTMLLDVWRYPGDALRRGFLLKLAECLGGEGVLRRKREVWERLYRSKSETSESKWRFNVRKAWWLLLIPLSYVVAIAVILTLVWRYAPAQAGTVGVLSIVMGLVIALFTALSNWAAISHSASTTTLGIPPLHSPEQFEETFEAMLEECGISAERDAAHLLVVIDNLDRCGSDDAADALRNIKTFLEKDGCIFIIACDDEALKDHLRKVYGWGEQSNQADEYLRKFFNTTVTIMVAREDHIQLVESLTSRMGFPKAVAEVLWAAAPASPRRVKQFLNRLRARELVLQREESSGRLGAEVRENLPFAAKMMVLEEQWRKFVDDIQSDDTLLARLREVLMDPGLLEAEKYADLNRYFTADPEGEYYGLEEFLRATSGVRAKDHRPFLNLRQYSYEVAIDETAILREDIRLGAFSRVGGAIAEADAAQVTAIWRTICQVIGEERQARRWQTALASANSATELFETCPEELKAEAAAAITTTACSLSSCLVDVLPRKVLSMLEHADPVWARIMVARMVGSLSDTGPYLQDLLSSLPAHHTLFLESHLRLIGLFLGQRLRDEHEAVLQVLRGLQLHDAGIQRLFASEPGVLSAVIGGLDAARVEQASNVADVYLPLKGIAPEAVRGEFVGKIGGLLHYPTDPPMGPQKELALSILGQLDLADIPSGNMDALAASLLGAIADVGAVPNKIRLWAQALRFRSELSQGQKQAMDSALNEAVGGWSQEHVGALTQLKQMQANSEASTLARGALASRILDVNRPWEEKGNLVASYVDTLASGADWELQELLGSMLDSADMQLVALAAQVTPKYFDRLRRDVQLRVLENLRERTRSLGLAHRHVILAPLTSLTSTKDDVGLRNSIGDELLSLMRDGDVSSVENGARLYGAYRAKLSKARRATNARELIQTLDRRRGELGEHFRPLLEVVAEESNQVKVGQPALVQLVHLLLSMTHSDRPADQRLLGITSLAKLESLPPQARTEVREQLETIASGAAPGDPVSDAAAGLYARFFDRDPRAPSEAPSGGEDAPGEEGAEAVERGGIAISSGQVGEFSQGREGPWSPPVPCAPIHGSWGSVEGARWVWLRERPTDADAKTGETVWHRLRFDVPVSREHLRTGHVQLMVDDVVHVHVNGTLVGKYGGLDRISQVDLSAHLRQGENLIEMQVDNNPGNPGSTGDSNPTGIIYRLDVTWE